MQKQKENEEKQKEPKKVTKSKSTYKTKGKARSFETLLQPQSQSKTCEQPTALGADNNTLLPEMLEVCKGINEKVP